MHYILIPLSIVALLYLLWRFAIHGRTGHPGLEQLQGWSYAHRGLHGEGVPENSMEAFRKALEGGYGIELDVHLLSDGGLAVIHDSRLDRTTGRTGNVEDLTVQQLEQYRLDGTDQTIPTFSQVLELYGGKAPLVIELKVHDHNVDALCAAACQAMAGYEGPWCMESFDPRCLLWLKKHRPEIIRGQLTENYFATKNTLPFLLKWILSCNLGNFLTKPDFIAYRVEHRSFTRSNRICMKRMTGVTWTVKTPEEYAAVKKEGWLPIFEGFRP